MIEALSEQLGGLGHTAFDDSDRRVAHLVDQRGEGGGRMRCELAGLGHHGVARGDRGHHRRQQQLHRVVPGGDHAHHAHRLGHDERLGRLVRQRRVHLLRLHPAAQVRLSVRDVVEDERDLREPGLEGRLAEVGGQRIEQLLLVLAQQISHAIERVLAPRVRAGGAGSVRNAGRGDLGRDVGERGDVRFHVARLGRKE